MKLLEQSRVKFLTLVVMDAGRKSVLHDEMIEDLDIRHSAKIVIFDVD